MEVKLARGLVYLDVIKIGYKMTLYGGTLDPNNYRMMFVGNVFYVRPVFNATGVVEVTYTCYSSNTNLKKDIDRVLYYPSENSPRLWANVATLNAKTLITKIVEEMGLTFGKVNNQKALILPTDIEFTHKTKVKQNMPDWGFLGFMAKKLGCKMWEEIDPVDGKYKFYFVDADSVEGDVASDVTFVYIARDTTETKGVNRLSAGQIQLSTFSCNEDSTMRTRNLRTVSMFDDDGNVQEVSIEHDETTDKLFYYKLNQDRLNSLPVEEQESLMRLIANSNFLESGVDYYFDKIEITKEQQGSVDWFTMSGRPDMGIEANIVFAGDVSIKPYRYYKIIGVSNRYSSEGSDGTWYMKSIKHTFTGQNGYTCTAKLYR